MNAHKLAMLGGTRVISRSEGHVDWPIVADADREAVQRVLASGKFVSNTEGEQEVKGLEQEWSRFVGTPFCVGVSNGTTALSLALAALGVQPGDEVLVPALSFVASALAPLHQLAIPVFVDIDPRTFNIDVQQLEHKITSRSRAILAVHLHGLPADMAPIRAIAARHGLVVLEDAAQAHGANYGGQRAGALGHAAGFSLSVSKNLPTCGEGGLITTSDPAVYERATMLRQFGEVIRDGQERSYISHHLGWNSKLSPLQAAFARSQLARFRAYQFARRRNVRRFLTLLSELPGIICPLVPPDRTHSWHILRFRFDPGAAGLADVSPGRFRKVLRRALRAEGVPMSQYQLVPLPGQKLFQTQDGFGRGLPWSLPGVTPPRYSIEEYPTAMAVIEDSLTLQRRHLSPLAGPLLDRYADAFYKVWENLAVLGHLARRMPYETPWEECRAEAAA